MVLEFVVWGSREWYEQALPLMEKSGFQTVPEMRWADAETDGERMGACFEYADDTPLSWEDLAALMEDVQRILRDAEGPLEAINIKRRSPHK